ncbi:MAG: TonB C-terminal domain-containing protein [Elusimicrobia bacterium]|nr:TonB C-terminal domain-containing protein [Elusimicrobiota bacterium]
MNEALKPYLARSTGLHVVAVAAFAFLASRQAVRTDKVYMIDFVGGPSATISSAGPAGGEKAAPAPAAASSAVAPQADPDAVNVKGRRRGPIVLPRPSLLRGGRESVETAPASSSLAGPGMSPSAGTALAPGPGASAGAASASAGVATDMPDFPYPWYISQVRLMLWQEWQKRMPRLDAEGAVAFSILRNGSYTDLAVESSSGDSAFDKAALESVQSAAPFPALPAGFPDPFLKIHLTLKSEEAWR